MGADSGPRGDLAISSPGLGISVATTARLCVQRESLPCRDCYHKEEEEEEVDRGRLSESLMSRRVQHGGSGALDPPTIIHLSGRRARGVVGALHVSIVEVWSVVGTSPSANLTLAIGKSSPTFARLPVRHRDDHMIAGRWGSWTPPLSSCYMYIP